MKIKEEKILIKIDLNKNEKENFKLKILGKKIKEEVKFFLAIISLISIFSSKSESLGYEKEISNCETKEEIISVSETFIYFVEQELNEEEKIKVEKTKKEIKDLEKNSNEDLKKNYLNLIEIILESKKINFENLDIKLDKKDKS
jgi:hypothetical protein